jgi:transcriptional regulator with PAS, ATPase and Fis domain
MDVWARELPAAITVCDKDGKILDMNERAGKTFEKDGGPGLIGKIVLDCHPEQAREKLKRMLATQESNCYTIEKKGNKKLICQAPWFQNGKYSGFVEISIDIPDKMPHFVRK